MATFIVYIDPRKRKKQKILGCVCVTVGLAFFTLSFFIEGNGLKKLFDLVISFNAVLAGIGQLRTKKPLYIKIDTTCIKFIVQEKFDIITTVEWNDIRWIKKEMDNSITIYRDSSFSNNIPLKNFVDADKKEILRLVYENAGARQIRLINFLEPVSAVA